jgi:UDP-2,3-diacylglucosamine pyrophosphatase LpxH
VNESTLVIVSDLHLGGGPAAAAWGRGFSDEFADDRAFSDFLGWLGGRPKCRLVLLGDVFDFLRVPVTGGRTGLFARGDAEAVAQLDRIAAAHPAVVEALSAALAAGVQVDFVSGNHDAELIRPAVRERLCALLGGHVRFHPWVLYIPGLLYAEHGHHHHDINTFVRPLYPYARMAGCLERPPAAWLGDLRRLPARPHRLWRDAIAGVRSRPPAAARADYVARQLPKDAEDVGLPWHVLAELHQLVSFSPFQAGLRLARKRLRRSCSTSRGYLPAAAADVRDLMARNRLDVPFYAFGHTHAAMRLPLGTHAWYLNSGTWSTTAWGGAQARRTWIEITVGAVPAAAARLFHWTHGAEPLNDGPLPDGEVSV